MVEKKALIINGGGWFGASVVEQSLRRLQEMGYETYVAALKPPKALADHYVSLDVRNPADALYELIVGLNSNNQTDLVIVTTGHGNFSRGAGNLCLRGSHCQPIGTVLDWIPYGQRVVFMTQCKSGAWKSTFIDDPKTLFTSQGHNTETTQGHHWAERFWSPWVLDTNQDGVVSWHERFSYGVSTYVKVSRPQFSVSPGFTDLGAIPFPLHNNEQEDPVNSHDWLRKKLTAGQYAVVAFSEENEPGFQKAKEAAAGQHLFLQSQDRIWASQYGVSTFPAVVIVSGFAGHKVVENHENILEEMARFEPTPRQVLEEAVERLRGGRLFLLSKATLLALSEEDLQWGAEEIRPLLFRYQWSREKNVLPAYSMLSKLSSPSSFVTAEAANLREAVRGRDLAEDGVVQKAFVAIYGKLSPEQLEEEIMELERCCLYVPLLREVYKMTLEKGPNFSAIAAKRLRWRNDFANIRSLYQSVIARLTPEEQAQELGEIRLQFSSDDYALRVVAFEAYKIVFNTLSPEQKEQERIKLAALRNGSNVWSQWCSHPLFADAILQ